jgi:hypothetical protein
MHSHLFVTLSRRFPPPAAPTGASAGRAGRPPHEVGPGVGGNGRVMRLVLRTMWSAPLIQRQALFAHCIQIPHDSLWVRLPPDCAAAPVPPRSADACIRRCSRVSARRSYSTGWTCSPDEVRRAQRERRWAPHRRVCHPRGAAWARAPGRGARRADTCLALYVVTAPTGWPSEVPYVCSSS